MSFWADPHARLRPIHDQAPVLWMDALDAWVVTGRTAVDTALRSTAVSSHWERQRPDAGLARRHPRLDAMLRGWFMLMDPPGHQRLRRTVQGRFVRRRVEEDRPALRSAVARCLDGFSPGRPVDVVADFAEPLSHLVVARVLGVPAEAASRAAGLVSDIASFLAQPHKAGFAAAAEAAVDELAAFYRHLAPGAAPDSAPAGLLENGADDHLHTAALLTFAGQETTTGLIGAGLVHLLRHEEQYRDLATGRVSAAAVVEELLRYDTPVPQVPRIALADFDLEGSRVRAGDRLVLFVTAANRDWSGDSSADVLDCASGRGHLAFGAGVHYCLGAPLARVAAQAAFEQWAERFPHARVLHDSVRWSVGRGYRALATALVVPSPHGAAGAVHPTPRKETTHGQ
ncbi:hypothetical protein [Streptomyces sediminimaris]|uniref:hypothetical protein n=1 Tax=Streptomyces sediminimaris TaxID=3383721 RepID=UPI00399C19A0